MVSQTGSAERTRLSHAVFATTPYRSFLGIREHLLPHDAIRLMGGRSLLREGDPMHYAELRRQLAQFRQRFGDERTASLLRGWNIPHLRPADDKDVQKRLDEGEEIVTTAEMLISAIVDADPDGTIYLRNVGRHGAIPPVGKNFWEMPAHLIRNPWLPPSPALPWLLNSVLKNDVGASAAARKEDAKDEAAPPQALSVEQPVNPKVFERLPVEPSVDLEAIERERYCLAQLARQRAALLGDGTVNFSHLVKDLYGLRNALSTRELSFVSDLLHRAYVESCLMPTVRQGAWLTMIARRMLNGNGATVTGDKKPVITICQQ